jgi:hypothetical protein
MVGRPSTSAGPTVHNQVYHCREFALDYITTHYPLRLVLHQLLSCVKASIQSTFLRTYEGGAAAGASVPLPAPSPPPPVGGRKSGIYPYVIHKLVLEASCLRNLAVGLTTRRDMTGRLLVTHSTLDSIFKTHRTCRQRSMPAWRLFASALVFRRATTAERRQRRSCCDIPRLVQVDSIDSKGVIPANDPEESRNIRINMFLEHEPI